MGIDMDEDDGIYDEAREFVLPIRGKHEAGKDSPGTSQSSLIWSRTSKPPHQYAIDAEHGLLAAWRSPTSQSCTSILALRNFRNCSFVSMSSSVPTEPSNASGKRYLHYSTHLPTSRLCRLALARLPPSIPAAAPIPVAKRIVPYIRLARPPRCVCCLLLCFEMG